MTRDVTDRFEIEVDTTHANDIWHREVADNLTTLTPG
jgi:3-ketosteroid 9alpha-monooxygenase subunit A